MNTRINPTIDKAEIAETTARECFLELLLALACVKAGLFPILQTPLSDKVLSSPLKIFKSFKIEHTFPSMQSESFPQGWMHFFPRHTALAHWSFDAQPDWPTDNLIKHLPDLIEQYEFLSQSELLLQPDLAVFTGCCLDGFSISSVSFSFCFPLPSSFLDSKMTLR